MKKNTFCRQCGKCCKETDMILTEPDMERILRYNKKFQRIEDFATLDKKGYRILKNVNDYCIFHNRDTHLCDIYEYRPDGCRFYPLIYDLRKKKCLLDPLCPIPNFFYESKKNLKLNCKKLTAFLKKYFRL